MSFLMKLLCLLGVHRWVNAGTERGALMEIVYFRRCDHCDRLQSGVYTSMDGIEWECERRQVAK